MKNLLSLSSATLAAALVSISVAYAAFPGDLGAATMSAGVSHDGTLVKSAGAVSVTVLSPANYSVAFGRDVTNCSFTATPTSAPLFSIVASNRGNNQPNNVYVATYNTQTQTYAPSGFNLIVHCGR